MNGRERVLTAMAGGKPDRVPIFISAYWDYWVRSVGADPFDYAYGEFAAQIDIEARAARRHAGVGLHRTGGLNHPGAPPAPARPARLPAAGPPPWSELIETHLPHLVSFDEAPDAFVHQVTDISRVIEADMAHLNVGANARHLQAIVETLSDEVVIACGGFGLFPHARRALGGVERAMYALAESPALVEAVLDALLEYYAPMIDAAASAGADAIWCGAYNEGADMVNPKMWRLLIRPRHEQLVRRAHTAGLEAICWFLGDCLPLVEDLAGIGYDMLIIEESRVGYSSDVGEMRRRIGNDLCLSGWVPELAMIRDDRETIRRHIEAQYDAAGRDGAFIFSTSMLDSSVNPETVDCFCEVVSQCR